MGTSRTIPIPAERILLIRPSALGDVCRTVPVLASLRAAWPDAMIDWIVQDSFIEAIECHPALNRAIPFPRRHFARAWRNPAIAVESIKWFNNLRRADYDLVLDCQGLGRSGLMTWSTLARRRVGHADAREFAWAAYTAKVCRRDHPHTVDAMLALVEACDIPAIPDMRLYSAEADRAWVNETIESSARLAVLAPTSRWSTKRWPAERWAELLAPLRERGWTDIAIIGAPGEAEQIAPLRDALANLTDRGLRIHHLLGETSIGQTMALIERAQLLIANDSAPLHMAVGFETPCVGLFGPTNIDAVGPYRAPESCVQRYDPSFDGPVHYRDTRQGNWLMRRISVADVLERVDAVVGPLSAARPVEPSRHGSGEVHHSGPVGAPVRVAVEKHRR